MLRLLSAGLASLVCLVSIALLQAADPLDLLDIKKPKPAAKGDDLDALLQGKAKGTPFRLMTVTEPRRDLSEVLYWRTMPGTVAAQTAPIEFRLGGTSVIAPIVGQTEESDGQAIDTYPTSGQTALVSGSHLLKPGDIPLTVKGGIPSSKHPAIEVVETKIGQEVRILCAPVRFEAVDEHDVPVPLSVQVQWQGKSLLRQAATFHPLVVWLPVGVAFDSSLVSFTLTASGQLEPSSLRLNLGVTATSTGLRKLQRSTPPPIVSSSNALQLTLMTKPTPARPGAPNPEPPKLAIYADPVAAPDSPLWIAIPQAKYAFLAGQKFAPEQLKATAIFSTDALTIRPATNPSPEAKARATSATGAGVDDLAWLTIDLPALQAGPFLYRVEGQFFHGVAGTVLIADRGQGWHLVPHRWRTVFTDNEVATYQLLLARGNVAGPAKIVAQRVGDESAPIVLGTVVTPAVESSEFDSRLFTIATRSLPTGDYQLWAESPNQRSSKVALSIVPWQQKSSFFVHSMSGCTTCWPTTDEGLRVLRDAGLEMATATGASSLLDTDMPQLDRSLAVALKSSSLPVELALRPTANDDLLSRMLRHQLRLIDLTVVRAHGMYNEGLSYHHSYQPSVDRMQRRMQLFTQHTADYPSFWGVNYSWFPAMGGYVEGGVATDPHTVDRNRVLAEKLKAQGLEPVSRDDWKWFNDHKADTDTAARAKVTEIAERGARYWKASNEAGWGQHNKLYNQAVHEVRPDLACTLFENAGHDEGKRTRDLFGDMSAVCYESYTDYGDWPMSSAFAVDWARGNTANKPVWLTTCWGTTPDGMMKSFFHAFSRGMAGGGVPMQSTNALSELARRGMGLRFASQYGALATHATPDRRVAILSRASTLALVPRGMWKYHALYYHLTRLGYPPILMADDEVQTQGIPDHVQVLMLADEQHPLEATTTKMLDVFTARGGKIVTIGAKSIAVPGAIKLEVPVTHLWEMKGFMPESHKVFWTEFEQNWRQPLAKTMTETGLVPFATTDVDRGLVVTMDAGPVRYATVIADAKGTHSNDFEPSKQLPVSLAETGWIVRDLVKQESLATTTKDDRTEVTVDLLTEPTTLLAFYRSAPTDVQQQLSASPRLGAELVFSAQVLAADQTKLGAVPVTHTLVGPEGRERGQWHRGAGDTLRFTIPAQDTVGAWQLTTEELLTGMTSTVTFDVGATSGDSPTLASIGDVHVVNESHLRGFAQRTSEKLVILEPDQTGLRPIAEQLVAKLTAAGVKARLWQVQPEEFDTIPLRWYPRPEDESRLKQIAGGQLIGYQGALKAYIHKTKREHIPELGGYSDVGPNFMVGQDCIVFSGGKLAESLRAVTPWMETPSVPGKEQGRLVVCFSPFMANRQVAAIVGNDPAGLAKAAAQLAEACTTSTPATTIAAAQPIALKPQSGKAEVRTVAKPYVGYQPIERVERLITNDKGQAVVFLRSEPKSLAFVDETGRVTASIETGDLLMPHARLDAAGRLLGLARQTVEKHPNWNFATSIELKLQAINPAGELEQSLSAYFGPTAGLPPDYEAGFLTTGSNATSVLGRARGFWYRHGGEGWRFHDDLPLVKQRFEAVFPRWPVGGCLSPDGRYLFTTMDSRPPMGAFSAPALRPMGAEAMLVDLQTGQRVWSLRDSDFAKSTYATHSGFAAVARDGAFTALADVNGLLLLIDKTGRIVAKHEMPVGEMKAAQLGPTDGLSVSISDNGQLAVYTFANSLVLARGDGSTQVASLVGIQSVALARDGSQVVVAQAGGRITSLDPTGQERWKWTSNTNHSLHIAPIGANSTLVVTGEGIARRLDGEGKEMWQKEIYEAAESLRKPLAKSANFEQLTAPSDYREPETLSYAQAKLGAKSIAKWSPSGTESKAFGRSFYAVDKPITLSGGRAGESCFLHLVYRRPAQNKRVTVTSEGTDAPPAFELDLLTPEYRVVDLPVSGGAKVIVATEGPLDVAECSLWSYSIPGQNMAFIKPAGVEGAGDLSAKPKRAVRDDDLLSELGVKGDDSTASKKARIWWPNSDPDQVAGPWLRAPVDPTQIVDGQRFTKKQLLPWAAKQGNFSPTRGGFFTVDFGKPQSVSLVVTYDRAVKQSEVAPQLAVFTDSEPDSLTSGSLLTGVTANDQFWRLIPFKSTSTKLLGVHLFKDATSPVGLSEFEAYK